MKQLVEDVGRVQTHLAKTMKEVVCQHSDVRTEYYATDGPNRGEEEFRFCNTCGKHME